MSELNRNTETLYLVFPKEPNTNLLNAILAQYPAILEEGRLTYTHKKHEGDIIPMLPIEEPPTFLGEEYAILETKAKEVNLENIRNAVGLLTYYPFDVYEIREYLYV